MNGKSTIHKEHSVLIAENGFLHERSVPVIPVLFDVARAKDVEMIKITYKILENHTGKKRRRPIRNGYCKVCGSKLSDPQSVEIGIGKRCLANNVAIILKMVPDDEPSKKACSGRQKPPSLITQAVGT